MAVTRRESKSLANYMEENLDMPLSEVLPIIQKGIMSQSTYFGVRSKKSPMDAWIYQEIISQIKPDVIVEIGNGNGGSTLFLAHLCDLLGRGKVIGLDLSHAGVPDQVREHPRISLIEGDACLKCDEVEKLIGEDQGVLVIEDSSHTYDNTLNLLRLYSRLVKPGGYFIVEDSICHHGLSEGPSPGPYEAIEAFVGENSDFEIDRSRERFLITWNPKGYLRRTEGKHRRSAASKPGATTRLRVQGFLVLLLPPIVVHAMKKLRDRG
ncbi:MAG: CmcI family methyltransferase [Dehalococcoidia bacterium]|nr:CmcI family methyltransferase [Dehalococcoidia bacterium]